MKCNRMSDSPIMSDAEGPTGLLPEAGLVRFMLEQHSEGVLLCEPSGTILGLNAAAASTLNLSREELYGKNIRTLLATTGDQHPGLPEMHRQPDIVLVLNAGDADRIETRAVTDPETGMMLLVLQEPASAPGSSRPAARRLDELTALHEIASASAGATSEDQLIERATRLIGGSLNPDNFGVLLLDEGSQVLVSHDTYHRKTTSLTRRTVPLGTGVCGTAAISGRPKRVPDVTGETDYVRIDPETRSEVCVPLKVNNRVIGVINAESSQLDAFSEEDEQFLETLASQLALAIENVRLLEAERGQRLAAETLRRATASITSSLELETVLEQILIHLEELVSYNSASIFLIEEDHLYAVAGRHFVDPVKILHKRYPLENDPLTLEIQQTGRPIIIQDARQDPRFQDWGELGYVRGWLGIPLVARDRVTGLLTLDSEIPGAFGDGEATLAQALANQAAMAIDNARLFEASQRQALELSGLYETALTVSSVLVIDALLARLREQVTRLMNPDGFGIFLYDAERERFEIGLAVEDGADVPGMTGMTIPVDQGGLTGWVIQSRSSLLIGDMLKDHLPIEPRHITLPARSWLGVPLIARDRLMGALTIQSFKPDAYQPSDLRFMESLAAQIAIALENARLFDEARRGVDRQEALNAIVTAAAAATDLRSLLDAALDQTLRALGLKAGAIWIDDVSATRELPINFYERLSRTAQNMGLEASSLDETVIVPDWYSLTADHPLDEFIPFITGFGIQATLMAPITSEGDRQGNIAVVARKRRQWSREEISLIQAVGQQIGSALQRLRLFEVNLDHTQFMKRLVPLSEALNRPFTVEEVVEQIGEGALHLSGAGQAAVFMRDDRDKFRCAWSRDLSEDLIVELLNQGGADPFDNNEPELVPDLATAPRSSGLSSYMRAEGIGAYGHWPLVYEGRVTATVGCYFDTAHQWSSAEAETMLAFARQAAIALKNAGLFADEKQRIEQLKRSNTLITALGRVAAHIEAGPDPAGVLDTVATELTGIGIQYLAALLDPVSEDLVVQFTSVGPKILNRVQKITGLSMVGFRLRQENFILYDQLVNAKQPAFLSDAIALVRPLVPEILGEILSMALPLIGISQEARVIYVPLIVDDQVIGVLGMWGEDLDESDTSAIAVFASQLAIAMENARLLEAFQSQNVRQAALLQLSTALAGTFDETELFRMVVRELHESLGYDNCGIFMVEPKTGDRLLVAGRDWSDTAEGWRLPPGTGLSERPLRDGQTHYTPDVSQAEGYIPGLPTGSEVDVPIRVGEAVEGVLVVQSRAPHAFDSADFEVISTAANQVGVAVARARLLEAERRRSQEFEALRRASLQATSSLELQPVLENILEQSLRLIAAKNAHIFFYEDGVITFGAAMSTVGYLDQPVALPRPHGLTYTVARTGKKLTIADANSHPLVSDRPWNGAIIGLPLCIGERVGGVMNIAFAEPHEFDAEEIRILELLADQAAIAINNARTYAIAQRAVEETRQRVQQLTLLYQLSQSLTSASLSSDQIATLVARQIVELLDVRECSVSLVDWQLRTLTTIVAYMAGSIEAAPGRSRTGKVTMLEDFPATERALATLQPLVVYASDPDADAAELAYMQTHEISTLAILPLAIKGKSIGVLELESWGEEHSYNDEQLNLVMTIANHAAVALENARLFEALQDRVNELSAISEVSAALRGAENVKEISQTVSQETARLLGADTVILYLLDENQNQLVAFGIAPEAHEPAGLPELAAQPDSAPEPISPYPEKVTSQMVFTWDLLGEFGTGICMPLRTSAGSALGVLVVAWNSPTQSLETYLGAEEERLLNTLSDIAANALQRARSHNELEGAYLQTVLSLARAMDARDSYTGDHSQRLAIWTEAIALEMGCTERQLQAVMWAALLHDIGKIGVPDQILLKPAPLDEEEWLIMKSHPNIGAEIIAPVQQLSDVVPIIRSHQEKFDGTGYPDGLKGEAIPLGARILAVADAYSAMTDDRVYRKARSHDEAVQELDRCAGTQFDPAVVDVFLKVLERQKQDHD